MLATDLWVLADLHLRIGEPEEAKPLFERALQTWAAHGHALPHMQELAIPSLEAKLVGCP